MVGVFLMSLMMGCAAPHKAAYDAASKADIVEVAKRVDLFWITLQDIPEDARTYTMFQGQYHVIENDLRALVMRNEIRPFNQTSTYQAQMALALWMAEKAAHKDTNNLADGRAQKRQKEFHELFLAMAKGEDVKRSDAE